MESKSAEEIINELKKELAVEKQKYKAAQEEIRTLKQDFVAQQAAGEQEEEGRINKLSKHLAQLVKEKESLALAVEQEEEYLTNTLGKKLADLQREKVDLENQLEQEEEFITNKLHKQLATVLEEKKVLEKRLEEEGHSGPALEKQIEVLTARTIDLEKKILQLKEEVIKLKTENFILTQKIKMDHEKLVTLNQEKTKLLANLEIGGERIFNVKNKSLDVHKRTRSVSLPGDVPTPTRKGSLPTAPVRKVSTGIPITKSRSSSGTLLPKALKEGWVRCKVKVFGDPHSVINDEIGKWDKKWFTIGVGELTEYSDPKKLSPDSILDLDTVEGVLELPNTATSRYILELVISPKRKSDPTSRSSLLLAFDHGDICSAWRDLLRDFIPSNPIFAPSPNPHSHPVSPMINTPASPHITIHGSPTRTFTRFGSPI
eukprot:TRINITY_DN4993_c0_g1_i1.p1 TRINITY_DN4993_c0_g1~~TRINITY_DN4993_c0_g1_i1.p1  ORF type:complete len:430 (+),score=88.52 TRINITY_DN4993_c0_g1_i1:466-1755(+)